MIKTRERFSSPNHFLQSMGMFAVLISGLSTIGLQHANATAIAAADIQAQLTFSLPRNGIDITFFDSFAVSDAVENGNSSALATALDPVNLGNGIMLGSTATATSSPKGTGFGVGAAFGTLEITNSTSNPIDVDFTLQHEWTIVGSVDDPSSEEAHTEIALDVFFNNVSVAPILQQNITPPNFTMGSGTSVPGVGVTQLLSDVSIPSGTTLVEIALSAQAETNSSVVPEPASLLLFGSGIVGFALYSRKRRQREPL